ncbi:GlyGly-CTERM sorting domain-containing protein [uncultured Fretibacterium sp.]|uniref:GlyGly-CTERM sorting domain-containing protein n=1 Tax=uncultured Fretibacterium sp. TaxID=1678694 RepID=UPI00344E5643
MKTTSPSSSPDFPSSEGSEAPFSFDGSAFDGSGALSWIWSLVIAPLLGFRRRRSVVVRVVRVLRAIDEGFGRAHPNICAGVVDRVPQAVELLHPHGPRTVGPGISEEDPQVSLLLHLLGHDEIEVVRRHPVIVLGRGSLRETTEDVVHLGIPQTLHKRGQVV